MRTDAATTVGFVVVVVHEMTTLHPLPLLAVVGPGDRQCAMRI